jgi:Fic family protein
VRREDFAPARRGFLVKTIRDQWAYTPPPLPDDLELSRPTIVALEKAAHALGDLNGAGQWMENPYLLIRPFLRREAVLSSKIEGTQASLSDLVVYEASPTTPPSMPEDVREVVNYVHAVDMGLRAPLQRPSLSLIRQLHRTLMTGVRGQERSPGEFRTDQNWIGRPGSPIEEASYVPPPPLAMQDALIEMESYLRSPTSMPTLAKIALAHYQFEAIHPFWDGNGRVGRLLVTLLLVGEGLVRQPLLYLSAFFERRRDEYYRRLAAASLDGEADEWIGFFLDGVHEQTRNAVAR